MDQQWLDSLSEDWISQPRSSPPASLPTSTPSDASIASQNSRSRIPRYKQRRSSASIDCGSVSRVPVASPQAVEGDSKALRERSFSDLNVPTGRAASKTTKEEHNNTSPHRGRKLCRTVSASTAQSTEHHTIQYKSFSCSPEKSRHNYETPEWKRRIVRGQVGYGEQRDLFGPSGLESIFQPPAPQQEQQKQGKKRNAQKFIAQDEIPSSPPPYQPTTQQSTKVTTHVQRTQSVGTTRLAVLNEEEEIIDHVASKNGSEPTKKHSAESRTDVTVEDTMKGQTAGNRTASGLEEERNEGISPIFVSRQNTIDGRIDYAALNQSMNEMRDELRSLHLKSNERMESETNFLPVHSKAMDSQSASPSILHSEGWTSQSLPGNLTTGTQEFVSRGGFVNLRRGGHSNEGSFQRRNLSPSSMPSPLRSDQTDDISTNAESSRRGSWPCIAEDEIPLPAAPTPPSLFRTPTKSQALQDSTPEKSRSSGSPLKLFGTYDTFTNERLLRRMSQFEESDPHEGDGAEHSTGYDLQYEGITQKVSVSTAIEMASQSTTMRNAVRQHLQQGTRLSSFGDGQLNGYEFEDFSHATGCSGDIVGPLADLSQCFPQSPTHKKRAQSQRCKAKTGINMSSIIKHRKAVEVRKSRTRPMPTEPSREQNDTQDVRKISSVETDGKRPLTSPVKDPTPKRRRTLHKTEIPIETSVCNQSVRASHHEMQKVIGMKRKDARHGTSQVTASPDIIASRRILHPRTPTLSQPGGGSTGKDDRHVVISSNASSTESEDEIETQAEAVAEELAAFGVNVGEHLMNGHRKPSVTTQDFLDEAVKIMDIIRRKGRPQSGLASLEESESEGHEPEDGYENTATSDSDSTKESFTRPPSREGLSVPKPRREAHHDPRVISHLRKFEEKEDTDDILVSSIKSLQISHPTQPSKLTEIEEFESQPPNIRIHQKRKRTDNSSPDASVQLPEIQIQSQSSQSSSYPSSGRTIPTGSSSSSNTRHIIAPDRVSHLIPGQVAGMTYDPTKKAWVKRKDHIAAQRALGEKSLSEESEQDPFGDIPDLTVDDMEELRRISDIIAKQSERERSMKPIDVKDMATRNIEGNSEQDVEKDVLISRPPTAQRMDGDPAESSCTVSRASVLRSSGPKTETRTTSWSEEDMMSIDPKRRYEQQASQSHAEERTVEVEHEFGIHEGRLSTTPPRPIARARNITIAFSSPVVSHIQHHEINESPGSPGLWSDRSQIEIGDSLIEDHVEAHEPNSTQRRENRRTSVIYTPSSTYRGAARRFSLGGRGFTARAVSRIEERLEETVDHPFRTSHNRSLDVTVSTPLPLQSNQGTACGPLSTSHISFHLSPLPDFTINENETSLQIGIGHVAKRSGQSSRKEIENSFALATQDLVRKITDVEPYEPYWEHIRKLELKDKQLTTLHVLNQFCGRLEELDVSNNEISQLSGAPSSIRNLKIQRNCLTGMTAWNHLTNLQYLDISGNEVESLDGFRDLVHLRELRADDNKITSLEGVLDLDGLLSLKVRRNLLVKVDFEATEM